LRAVNVESLRNFLRDSTFMPPDRRYAGANSARTPSRRTGSRRANSSSAARAAASMASASPVGSARVRPWVCVKNGA